MLASWCVRPSALLLIALAHRQLMLQCQLFSLLYGSAFRTDTWTAVLQNLCVGGAILMPFRPL